MKRIVFSVVVLLALKAAGQSPDLIVDQARLASSVELQTNSFSTSDCATIEGCASEGLRRLVKFDAGLINIGDGDLLLGEPQANPDLFVFSPCHGHYHLKGVADYELISSDGTVLITARKQAFCLRDDIAAVAGAGPAKYNCDFQGISPGWEDVYDKSLDCQWLDITGVPDGDYILRVVLNPERVFVESNYDNNDASVAITLRTSTPPPPPPPTNGNCKCTCKCKKDNGKKPWDWKHLADKFKNKDKKENDNCVCKPKNGKAKGHCCCNAKSGSKGKCGCSAKCPCKHKAKGCGCKGKGHGGDHDDNDDDQGKGDDDHDGGKDDDHDDD